MNRSALVALWLVAVAGSVFAQSGTVQSTRLHTPPDPSATGGIRARLNAPDAPLIGAFAMPTHDFKLVYRATRDADGRGFRFHGLPVGKYDLVLQFAEAFHEGLTLSRDADALTAADRESINTAINRAVPFFDTKQTHRVAGQPGRAGAARAVLQELRTRRIVAQSAEELTGYQIRSFKLVLLRDVGKVGWQMFETREIVRTEVPPGSPRGILAHHYTPALGNIRVVDSIRDLGTLELK